MEVHVLVRYDQLATHHGSRKGDRLRLAGVLASLFVTGWSSNHFASLIPILKSTGGLSTIALDAAFAIYAVGLLPGLLCGGSASDRVGRKPTVLIGGLVAGVGNLSMSICHNETGVIAGRLIVGVGAGIAISSGTAWAADIRGRNGIALSGAWLTAGFVVGAVVTSWVAQALPWPLYVPFAIAGLTTLAGMALTALLAPLNRYPPPSRPSSDLDSADAIGRTVSRTLWSALPMALWVFSTSVVAIVVVSAQFQRFHDDSGAWIPALATLLSSGTGMLVQFVVRRMNVGPIAGVVGSGMAAVGFTTMAVVGADVTAWSFVVTTVTLGVACGLCLRDGLTDVESMAPVTSRGVVTGVFYVASYLGFAVPLTLSLLSSAVGMQAPLVVLAAAATGTAVSRAALRVRQR
ncbi:MFS transporter [Rhodococcus koreensis]